MNAFYGLPKELNNKNSIKFMFKFFIFNFFKEEYIGLLLIRVIEAIGLSLELMGGIYLFFNIFIYF